MTQICTTQLEAMSAHPRALAGSMARVCHCSAQHCAAWLESAVTAAAQCHPATAGYLLQGHTGTKGQPAQRPRHTWESFSESVCCAAMHCRGSATPCTPYAIGNVSACPSHSCVFYPRHLGPAVAISGCLRQAWRSLCCLLTTLPCVASS